MSEQPETKRGRGRPRSFDPDDALDAAIALFWTKGYDATSLDDLGAAMGLRRPSIYRAFGAKDELFLTALTRYRDSVAAGPIAALQASGTTVKAGLAAFLGATVDYVTADPKRRGCLIGSVASAVADDGARGFAAKAIGGVQADVAAWLAQAVDAGELPAAFDVAVAARRAVDAMLSLTARARLGAPAAELRASIPDRVALVLHVS